MSTKETGGPAFPCQDIIRRNDRGGLHGPEISSDGISVRDCAALKALQGFCANPAVFSANGMTGWGLVNCSEEQLTNYAYFLADAMLKARQS
jgi:hypothetical protein